MGAVFSLRNAIYWWVFLTSFIFLSSPARLLASNFRSDRFFAENNFPFSLATGITQWISTTAAQVVRTIQFDPNAIIIQINGRPVVNGFLAGVAFCLILLVLAVRFYIKAVRSPRVFDDILAIIICFFVYHLEAQTLIAIKVPFGNTMATDRATWVLFLAAIIVALVVAGKGFTEGRVFWRGLLELFFAWLFLIPRSAAGTFATLLEWFANAGQFLDVSKSTPLVALWALAGMLAALYRLYTAQTPSPPKPAGGGGGGGGGPKPAAAPLGGGGLLARLRRH